jgi:hypothetical protein
MWTTRNGKIAVESKDDIIKRLRRSPNKGDAAVYWNWVRRRPGRDIIQDLPGEPSVVVAALEGGF